MKHTRGFTVIELSVVIVLLAIGSWLFFTQKVSVDAVRRDEHRKIAINAIYYTLEEVYYEQNKSYPESIDSKTLRAVDPNLFKDPYDIALGTADSDYRYEPTGCTDKKCTGYTLRSSMEREADYIKKNRNK